MPEFSLLIVSFLQIIWDGGSIVRPVVAPLTNQVQGQAPSRILPPSNIICNDLTINDENSGISPKRHHIRVPQIDSIGIDV